MAAIASSVGMLCMAFLVRVDMAIMAATNDICYIVLLFLAIITSSTEKLHMALLCNICSGHHCSTRHYMWQCKVVCSTIMDQPYYEPLVGHL